NEKKYNPPDRQSLERGNLARVLPNARTKSNYTDCDQQRDKTVYHLQPNLESVYVRQATRIAPGVDLCQCCDACIRDPRAVCRGKIENRQIAMLMAHCCSQRKLNVNRKRYCDRKCSKGRKFFRTEINFLERAPKPCRHKRDQH